MRRVLRTLLGGVAVGPVFGLVLGGALGGVCTSALAQERGGGPAIEPRTTPAMLPDASGLLATTLPADFEVVVQSLPPEGSMLPPTTGELVALPTGDIVFRAFSAVADAAASADADASSASPSSAARVVAPELPVFALLPSPRLIQIRSVMERARGAARASGTKDVERDVERMPRAVGTISGQIFIYRNRAFLSPASFAEAAVPAGAMVTPTQDKGQDKIASEGQADKQATTPAGNAAGDGQGNAQGDAAAAPKASALDELFGELEQMPSAPRVLAPGASAMREQAVRNGSAIALDAPLLSDGTVIVGRAARLVRMAELGGRLGLAFDNDGPVAKAGGQAAGNEAGVQGGKPTSSPTDELPTLALLPCTTLERMEQLAAQHADALTFVVTGRIVSDGDRNAFMPLFFQARMASGVVAGQ
jgi:hypothetical protein